MRNTFFRSESIVSAALVLAVLFCFSQQATAQTKKPTIRPEFPPHSTILKGYQKVVSTADGKRSLYTIWVNKKENQMYAELPANYASQKYFFAMTVAGGEDFAGLQAGDLYVYWRKYGKRLALMSPNTSIVSTGDAESKGSIKRLFTDRMLLDVPIVTKGPSGGPVIDMDALLVGKASLFFGSRYSNRSFARLFTIKKAKAFPLNVELAFEVPTMRGQMKTLHYSISSLPAKSTYKPRKADQRIGYFTVAHDDFGKYTDKNVRKRYITRWNLQKADPSLKISPPKKPIIFYIENSTPIRYRRWVRKGLLDWNKAFEKIGISNAIEVHYQDARSGANMEKDPEDVRYNFVRWLNNSQGLAIGPSRVHPMTGEILDADIVIGDGWIRHYRVQFQEVMPKIAMQNFNAETLAWFRKYPQWDPRVIMAAPEKREAVKQRFLQSPVDLQNELMGMSYLSNASVPSDELISKSFRKNRVCMAADGLALDVGMMRMHFEIMNSVLVSADSKPNLIDGMPEKFVGPLVAHLVAHECGHTLGLRHNFKGSTIHTLAEINSDKFKGKKQIAGSVMDYLRVNLNFKGGKIQGDYSMTGIGPYDAWAIEYGYSFAKDLKPILSRVAEPELAFATDEDSVGPDPLARRHDFGKDPLNYANEQMRLVKYHRANLLKKFVKDGESWARARSGYESTFVAQMRSLSMMANWVGGAFVFRDKKGDKNARTPIKVVPSAQQRAALKFVIENSFFDASYNLSTELLTHLTDDKWLDDNDSFDDAPWKIHDSIRGVQSMMLSLLMNPTTLRRVFDNEMRLTNGDEVFSLPELIKTVNDAAWKELDTTPKTNYTVKKPMISSLRRSLQREHVNRMIDLSMMRRGNPASDAIADLSKMELKKLDGKIVKMLKGYESKMDDYTKAHLSDVQDLIQKALKALYVIR